MNLLLLLLILLLFPSLRFQIPSVLVGASSFELLQQSPSPISPFLDSMTASSPGGYFTDLSLSALHRFLYLIFDSPLSNIHRNFLCFVFPGIPMGMETLTNDTHKKMLISLIVCASFGAVLVVSLFLWIYYRRNSPNFHKRNGQSSGKTHIEFF